MMNIQCNNTNPDIAHSLTNLFGIHHMSYSSNIDQLIQIEPFRLDSLNGRWIHWCPAGWFGPVYPVDPGSFHEGFAGACRRGTVVPVRRGAKHRPNEGPWLLRLFMNKPNPIRSEQPLQSSSYIWGVSIKSPQLVDSG